MGNRAPVRACCLGAAIVALAGAIVTIATWDTTGAEITASTDNSSNRWSAGHVDIETDAASRLLFDAENLYPGLVVENCVRVAYVGSVENVTVRVFGDVLGGTGLDRHLRTTLVAGDGGAHDDCAGFVPVGPPLFSGTLARFAADRGTFTSAPALMAGVDPGASRTLKMTVAVADDDAAQGLVTEFAVVIEARP